MCDIRIKQVTKKVKQLFQLKSKNTHPSGVTYEGTFSCKESNIGETTPNIEIRREEHEDTQKDSQAANVLETIWVFLSLEKFSCRPQQISL